MARKQIKKSPSHLRKLLTQGRRGAALVLVLIAAAGGADRSAAAQPVASPNWSGVVLSAPAPTQLGIVPRFTYVSAVWTVPNATRRAGACNGLQPVEQWIGLDGAGGPDVLQAGVATFLDCATGHATASAWFGWYPGSFANAATVPDVSPGDTVEVYVWVDAAGLGHGWIGDRTTGRNSGVMSTSRPSGYVAAAEVGYTAEWIVEDNADGAAGMADNAPPAQYGSLAMVECWAADQDGNGYAPGTPGAAPETLIALQGGDSTAAVIGPQAVLFQSAPQP